jgi:GNAT superfamily N-acetyltransferase
MTCKVQLPMIRSMTGFIVRPMRAEDAAAVIDMARALAAAVGDPEPKLTTRDLIRHGLGSERWFDGFVADSDGVSVGYALACKAYEAHTGSRRLWLGDLYVRPQARCRGAGRALVAAVARHAATLSCNAVYLELWRMNQGGGAFYRRLGAEVMGELAVMRIAEQRLAALTASPVGSGGETPLWGQA